MNHPNYDAILKWYRGKALAAIQNEAIPLLRQSVDQGYWVPKASRRVKSLLSKTSKTAVGPLVDAARADESYGDTYINILYGSFLSAPSVMYSIVARNSKAGGYAAHEGIAQWAVDFAPIALLCNELDELRPKPTDVATRSIPHRYLMFRPGSPILSA